MKDGQDPLDVLTPGQHTVGYLYILCVLCLFSDLSETGEADFTMTYQECSSRRRQYAGSGHAWSEDLGVRGGIRAARSEASGGTRCTRFSFFRFSSARPGDYA